MLVKTPIDMIIRSPSTQLSQFHMSHRPTSMLPRILTTLKQFIHTDKSNTHTLASIQHVNNQPTNHPIKQQTKHHTTQHYTTSHNTMQHNTKPRRITPHYITTQHNTSPNVHRDHQSRHECFTALSHTTQFTDSRDQSNNTPPPL
ncbi:unnamed protein product [Schistosoma spindalis]|nr:unnamed protein product [Schistosoma spindale]